MEPADVMELAGSAFIVMLTVVGPMLLICLIVGVAIGLFQALTQIQEMTLTFVPKLVAIGIVFLMSLPMIGATLSHLMADISQLITRG
ncbi:flagellar biosynthetic protein FliQ [Sphingorhabdus sp. M41]|uniref:flagellar biosynthetic protein FliQ n=1 Tax=Sphingorhabdus sp. M41 TaxID=1806885 RepID=UPI00078EB323|nr:flagellar biosynthetic protein FliQ [Sphingorhabdus sp. M41]AMO72618.1 flagellar biosynthetic protein FliQ [Sphingorhabdus sp. M41]